MEDDEIILELAERLGWKESVADSDKVRLEKEDSRIIMEVNTGE